MVGVVGITQRATITAARMVAAAQRYLERLDDARRKATRFAFEDQERFRWNYRPERVLHRRGDVLARGCAPDRRRRRLSRRRRSGCWIPASAPGRLTALAQIMALEDYLREQDG